MPATEFTSRQLTSAVNLMKPAPTRVLDTVFSRKIRQFNSIFEWDVKASTEGIMPNISVYAEATVRAQLGRQRVTCTAPRFSEKTLISAHDLENLRAFGGLTQELLGQKIGDEQADMKARVDLTREFMAVKALQGTVVDKSGATLVDYNFAASHTPTLTGDDLWTDAESNPVNQIRAWKKLITQEGGAGTNFHAFCGTEAMDALIANSAVLELLKYSSGSQIAETGRIASLAGVSIEEYMGSYTTDAGVITDLIPADAFILVATGPNVAAELFAPIVDFKAPNGLGKPGMADMFFSKMWETEDPSGQWLKIEARPLPVIFQPKSIVCATVV